MNLLNSTFSLNYVSNLKSTVFFNFLLRFQKNKEIEMNSNSDLDVLRDLKLIGKIKEHEKLLIISRMVENDSLLTAVKRTWYKEDRTGTLKFIKTTIDRSFDILDKNKNKNKNDNDNYYKQIEANIIADLNESIKGILNIRETYSTDISFCCAIDTIIQDTVAKLDSYLPQKPEEHKYIENK